MRIIHVKENDFNILLEGHRIKKSAFPFLWTKIFNTLTRNQWDLKDLQYFWERIEWESMIQNIHFLSFKQECYTDW